MIKLMLHKYFIAFTLKAGVKGGLDYGPPKSEGLPKISKNTIVKKII